MDAGLILLPTYSSCILTALVLLNFVITVYAYVTLNFHPEIVRLNENINIICTVHGIDVINSRLTRQWSKGPDVICYNGHPIDSSKYTEILTSANQFQLQIKNITELDVDCKYQCRYGFESNAKSIQSSKGKFEYPPVDKMRAIVHTNESNGRLTIDLHFEKIFPLPKCTALYEGASLSFNTTSSKSYGNYYEVMLRHQSIDKFHCNGEVVVKCKLIKEYIIPIKDLRQCSLEANQFRESRVILLGIFIPILLLILCILFLIICKQKRPQNECVKMLFPCHAVEETGSKSIHKVNFRTSCNSSDHRSDQRESCISSDEVEETGNKSIIRLSSRTSGSSSDQRSDQKESFISSNEDTETYTDKKKEFTDDQRKNQENHEESVNMITNSIMSVCSLEEMTYNCNCP